MSEIKNIAATKTIILPAEKKGKKQGKYETALLMDLTAKKELPFSIATLIIHENNGDRSYRILPLNSESSLRDYKKLPHEITYPVRLLTTERLNIVKQEAEQKYNSNTENEIPDKEYLAQKILAHVYARFQELKPFRDIVKWYW